MAHDDRTLARRGLALQAEQSIAIAFLQRLRGQHCEIAHLLRAACVEQRHRSLRVGIGNGVLNGIVQRRLAAGAVDIGQHLTLLDHLLMNFGRCLVARAPVDETDDGEVRQ